MEDIDEQPPVWLCVLSWVTASVPPACILLIGASAAYIRLSFGRWPIVYRDTVNAPFTDAAVNMAAISAVAVLPAIGLLPIVASFRAMSGVRPALGRWATCLAIGWFAAFILLRWDPTGFVEWVFD